jgi:hypothetical protein
MSLLINNLKMRCSVSRIPTSPEGDLDEYGMYKPEFSTVYTDVKCYFQYLRMAGGKLKFNESGQQPENVIIGLIDKGINLIEGDLIDCPDFYPRNFYVASINPIINGRTGILSHFEITVDLEKAST